MKKPSKQKKDSVSKLPATKKAASRVKGQQTVKAFSMTAQDSSSTVGIERTVITIQRGHNYRVPLDFSQAPNGAGQFENAMYATSLTAPDHPEAVIQEDINYKTEQRCAWIVYVPDDGYQTTINLALEGQLQGTGWTGGASVDGLWGTPQLIY
jgi:hypothetical protein